MVRAKVELLGGPLCSSGYNRRSSTAVFCFVAAVWWSHDSWASLGQRAFAVFGPSTWNTLPAPLWSADMLCMYVHVCLFHC